ncbi:hypothetical protein DO61_4063 [Burkholderia mallei]|nr:hypothetical protein DO61_4063 [Burkholderia mallei]
MRTKPVLTSDDVNKMAAAAEAFAAANQWAVTVAIFDDGAHLLHLHRMDGAAPSTVEMAIGKGRTAALGRRESKVYEDIVLQGRISFLSRAARRPGRGRRADRRRRRDGGGDRRVGREVRAGCGRRPRGDRRVDRRRLIPIRRGAIADRCPSRRRARGSRVSRS